jgi:hypothetical protein
MYEGKQRGRQTDRHKKCDTATATSVQNNWKKDILSLAGTEERNLLKSKATQ